MISFAMETPSALYNSLGSWSDFDFVLAHKVINDHWYATRLTNRSKDRMLILDNSMHELGEAMPIDKLLDAAKKCRADYVIPPDKLDAPAWNVQQFARAWRQFKGAGTSVAAVMCGEDSYDRLFSLENYREKASMILLPFRKPRLKWFLEHRDVLLEFSRVHLLGVNTLEELGCFAAASTDGTTKWSVDTAKPLKWAMQNVRLSDIKDVRGATLSSKELLDLTEMSQEVRDLTYENIEYVKGICRGGA